MVHTLTILSGILPVYFGQLLFHGDRQSPAREKPREAYLSAQSPNWSRSRVAAFVQRCNVDPFVT